MSRISIFAVNDILIHGKTLKRQICNLQRVESFYHYDTMLNGGLSELFLKIVAICIPPRFKELSGIDLIPSGKDIKDRPGKIVGFNGMPYLNTSGLLHPDIPALPFSQETSKTCGNDMIDVHVENLLDSKLPTGFLQSLGKVSDFPTTIWLTASQLTKLPQSLLLLFFLIFKKRR